MARLARQVLFVLAVSALAAAEPVRLDLDPAACQLQGVTLVPARPLCHWLGVELTQLDPTGGVQGKLPAPAAGTWAVAVGARTARVGTRSEPLPHVALAAADDVLLPLRFLTTTFDATAKWDEATRQVTLRHGDKEAVFTVASPVYPLVETGGLLIGGQADGRWVSPAKMAERLAGGEKYRLYGLAGALGLVTGGKPEEEDPGPFQHVTLTPEAPAGTVALRAPWNCQPRPVKVTDTTQAAYLEAVGQILRAKGLSRATPRLVQVLRVDLDGDGDEEVLFTGSSAGGADPSPRVAANSYSFVALRDVVKGKVRTQVLDGEFRPRAAEFGAPNEYRVLGCLDLDGDNSLEVVVSWRYYEGAGVEVFKFRDHRADNVLSAGAGA